MTGEGDDLWYGDGDDHGVNENIIDRDGADMDVGLDNEDDYYER